MLGTTFFGANEDVLDIRQKKRQSWLDYVNEGNLTTPHPEHMYLPCLQANEYSDEPTSTTAQSSSFPSICNVLMHVRPVRQQRRIPPKTKSKRTASLCLFIKNEHLYVNEYVDYHLRVGFDEILIYDNSVDFNLKDWATYKQQETGGRVLVTHFPGMRKQVPAYRQCTKTSQERNHTWMGVFDTDEMLVMYKHDHVVDLLEEHCQSGALSLYWYVYGHAYETRYRPFPLAQRFRYRFQLPDQHYKSIGKLSDITKVDLHFMKVNKSQTRTLPNQAITQHNILGHDLNQKFNTTNDVRSQSSQVAAVHHYWLKSVEEWFIKACWRGRPIDIVPRKKKNQDQSQESSLQHSNCNHALVETSEYANEYYDDDAWKALKHFVPEYASLDQYV